MHYELFEVGTDINVFAQDFTNVLMQQVQVFFPVLTQGPGVGHWYAFLI